MAINLAGRQACAEKYFERSSRNGVMVGAAR
jgi:hypothetical protein